jgi:dUTP pyrophosphatase
MSDTPYEIKVGDRIGQGIFVKYGTVKDDATTATRSGGFGSTNA